MHRSHEYVAKIGVELCDGVLIHQVLGKLKAGDIPANVRVEAIDALVKRLKARLRPLQIHGDYIEVRRGRGLRLRNDDP